jgi:hydroxypyruvate isomerase
MLKFSPCVEMMWTDFDFPERVARAAALGFKAFEFWGWWDKDLDAVEKAAKNAGLPVAACCVKTIFMDKSIPPMLLPEGKDAFVESVRDCVKVAPKINCSTFIVTTGDEIEGVSRANQHAACVDALKAVAPIVEDAGITLVLEPLNLYIDHIGYYLGSSAEGFKIVEETASPNVKLLFDIYHMQINEGNLARSICENIDKIGHLHIANNPGRHEPAFGEINYPYLYGEIASSEYNRFLGLEFSPSDPDRTDEILLGVLKGGAAF